MIVKRFIAGSGSNNVTLVKYNNQYFLIDAPSPMDKIIKYLEQENIKIDYCFITHTHYDHIAGLAQLKEYDPTIKVVVSSKEAKFLTDPSKNLSELMGVKVVYHGDYEVYEEISISGIEFKFITGHSKSSCVIIFEGDQLIFSGDTLFRDSVGRSDFIFGNHEALIEGIRENIFCYPDEYKVYPGHGFNTTVGNEKSHNRHLQ